MRHSTTMFPSLETIVPPDTLCKVKEPDIHNIWMCEDYKHPIYPIDVICRVHGLYLDKCIWIYLFTFGVFAKKKMQVAKFAKSVNVVLILVFFFNDGHLFLGILLERFGVVIVLGRCVIHMFTCLSWWLKLLYSIFIITAVLWFVNLTICNVVL